MKQSSRRLMSLLVAAATGLSAVPASAQVPPPETQLISIQIATGPVSGSYSRVGEAIARIISHPPGGLARCETAGVCGPEGLVATSRSSSGSVANAVSVNSGRVRSAIVQADVAEAAFLGEGPFKESGPLKNLRVIARLHDETLHLVVAARSRIKRLRDLKGRRVAIDASKSGTHYLVRRVLGAARVSRVRYSFQGSEQAARDLRDGKIDAFFVLGVAPIKSVDGLLRRGQARLVGLDTPTIAGLSKKHPMYSKADLPADTYRGSRQVATLNVASLWLVHESLSPRLVQSILRSLWNPANRAELRRLGPVSRSMDVAKAAEHPPLPLHAGAERFYAEAGR